jgi:alpha-tubulin suppressor-like RCC1 family protein
MPLASLRAFTRHSLPFIGRLAALLILAWALPAQSAVPVAKLTVVRPVVAGQSVTATLLATDAEGDPLTYEIVSQPSRGQVTLLNAATGDFRYDVPAGVEQNTRERFSFRVMDGSGSSAVQSVFLTVYPTGTDLAVRGVGSTDNGMLNVSGWRDVVAIAANGASTLGLRSDGTVLCAGGNYSGECNVSGWNGIIAIAAGYYFSAGVRANGTVAVATTWTGFASKTSAWRDIVAVAAGANHLIGLKADGTVVAAHMFSDTSPQVTVGAWTEIVAVSAGWYHSVGLKADGTVLAVGSADYNSLVTGGWSNVAAISADGWGTFGLKADGTVYATGYVPNVTGWSGITALDAGGHHVAGLRADGTVQVAKLDDFYGHSNVTGWKQVVALAADNYTTVSLVTTPLASDLTFYRYPGETLTLDPTAQVLDVGGETLIVTAITQGAHGSVTDNGNGTYTYASAPGFSGIDTFSYTVTDGHASSTGTVSVNTSSDWDTDGTPNADDAFPLDPAEFVDTDHDGTGNNADQDDDNDGVDDGSDPAPLNARPVAQTLNMRPILAGQSLQGSLHGSDLEGDGLTFELVSRPVQGDLVMDPATGAFTYNTSVDSPWLHRDSFSFRVRDGFDASEVKTVSLNVRPQGQFTARTFGDSDIAFGWEEFTEVSVGDRYALGLRMDGTVAMSGYGLPEVYGWTDIVAISAADRIAAGVKSDGTVVLAGDATLQLAVSGWQNIAAVSVGPWHVVGLREDGTVVATGIYDSGQLAVEAWRDVVAIGAGEYFTIGVKSDGKAIAASYQYDLVSQVDAWTGVVAAAGRFNAFGLRRDGSVVAAGIPDPENLADQVATWRNVVALATGPSQVVGVKADGTMVAAGYNPYGQLNLAGANKVWMAGTSTSSTVVLESMLPRAANIELYAEPFQTVATPDLIALASGVQGWAEVQLATPPAYGQANPGYDGTVTYFNQAEAGSDRFTYRIFQWAPSGSPVGLVNVTISYDWDNDGTPNFLDELPLDPTETMDTDHDGIGNLRDTDDDGDGLPDDSDPWPLNARPVAQLLNVRPVLAGETVNGTLRAYDPENDPRMFELVTSPSHGTVTSLDSASGQFTYVANGDYAGRDSFTFRASDATGMPTEQIVHLTVRSRGDAVLATGANWAGELNVSGWHDVVDVASGETHTVGLKADGTVLAAGEYWAIAGTETWSDIVALSAGSSRTVAVRADGTAVAVGYETPHHAERVSSWSQLAAVAAAYDHTVGLKEDGTVVATGSNEFGQLNVSGWRDIVAIAASSVRTVGLKADGTVVTTGYEPVYDVSGWTEIVAVSASDSQIVGLRADGTVVAAGSTYYGENDVWRWHGIKAVAAGNGFTLGLMDDGTVLSAGSNTYGETNVVTWNAIQAVSASYAHSVGVQRAIVALPEFNRPSGAFEAGTTVSITTSTADAAVRYTLDGSDPTEGSTPFTAPIQFMERSYTAKARAFKAGWAPSPIATVNYAVYAPVQFVPGGENSFTLTGGSGSYNITANANGYGASGTLVHNADGSYTFVPPTTGAFAGDYVIDVTDPATGAVHHLTITVPLRVTKERSRLLSYDPLRNDMEVQVRGTAPGTGLSLTLDPSAFGAGLTVTASNGVAENDAAAGNPARFLVTAPDNLAESLTATMSAGAPGVSGTGSIDAVAAVPYAGSVFNVVAEPVPGATVTLLSALGAAAPLPWEDDLGRITATTGANGSFTLFAPPTGADEVHSLRVTAQSYATAVESAANCLPAPCTVTLDFESNAAAPGFTPAAGTYEQNVLVTVESSTVDATLRYSTDGSTPTRTSGIEAANGTGVQLHQSSTLRAVAYKAGLGLSAVAEAAYVVVPAKAASGLTATVVNTGEIDLAWGDNSAVESGYRIYRATGDGSFAPVALVGADVTAWADTGLAANTRYRYYVVAYISGAESAPSDVVTATTVTDTTAPTVLSVVPAANATSVQLNKAVTVNFSEPVNCATVTATSFTLKNPSGTALAGTITCSGATATFTPTALLSASTKYTARVTVAVKDLAGNAMGAAKSWSFTTDSAKDTVKPTVSATVPAAGASGVAVTQTVTATFSENIDCASVTSSTVTLSAGGLSVPAALACSGKVVTLDPASLLSAGTAYTLTITTGVRDLARNTLAANYTAGFTTAP